MNKPITCRVGVGESIKNAELLRRRKLRLEQVRQRSKDFAADLRKKVHDEKNRQMQQYNATKAQELRAWKQNQLKQTQTLYEANLAKIGDAHLAARRENAVDAKIVEKNRQSAIVAKRRGLNAMAKMRNAQTSQRGNVFVRTAGTKVDGGVVSKAHTATAAVAEENSEAPGTLSQSVTQFVEISSDDDDELSSSMEIQSTAAKLSKTLPLVYTNQPNPYTLEANIGRPSADSSSSSCMIVSQANDVTATNYDPRQFAVNDSADGVSAAAQQQPKPVDRELPFTQVSQFLSNRRKELTVTSDIRTNAASSRTNSLPTQPPPEPAKWPTTTAGRQVTQVVARKKPLPPKRPSPIKSKPREYVPLFGPQSTTKSTITADSSANILRPDTVQRVKFYDHANRFAKEYSPAPNIVQRIEPDPSGPTAADVAVEETKLDELKLDYLNELKKKAELRSQQCLEKEHMRKDYEKMMAQLEELSKREQHAQMYKNNHPSCTTFAKQNDDLQQKLNEHVEREIFHKPIPITCPRFISATTESDGFNLAQNAGGPLGAHLNSSDSANSIYLGQTATGQPKKTPSVDQHRGSNKENVQNEDQRLFIQQKENLEKLTERMKAKEKSLERKAKKLFLAEMMRKKRADKANQTSSVPIQNVEIQTDDAARSADKAAAKNYDVQPAAGCSPNDTGNTWQSTSTTTTTSSTSSPPVKIIIKVNGRRRAKSKSSPTKPVSVHVKENSDAGCRKVYPKTPVKPAKKVDDIEQPAPTKNHRKSDEQMSSTSTVYKTLPSIIRTEMSAAIEPPKLADKSKTATFVHTKPTPTNPLLRHYITRLLGMSRTSIEQLGVSSSTSIETPADSIINVTGNCSTEEHSVNDERLTKLQQFIADNHSLLTEMERAMHRDAVPKTTPRQSDAVGKVWVDTLQQNRVRKVKDRRAVASQPSETVTVVPKPILKNVTEKSRSQQSPTAVGDEAKMTRLYAQLTENCNQRFAELNDKINKVRREKQMLLEGTLSPGAAAAAVQRRPIQSQSHSLSSSSDRDMPSSEYCSFKLKTLLAEDDYDSGGRKKNADKTGDDAMGLSQSKHIGLSRDSGICTSRPVTSSDMRDSPDIRTIKFDQKQQADSKQMDGNVGTHAVAANTVMDAKLMAKSFEPLLKDIPKYNIEDTHDKLVDVDGCDAEGVGKIGAQKRVAVKPPASLKRYSPHMEELPHELSTIIEIDTPATSQLNASINNTKDSALAKLLLQKWPTFQEYIRELNLDATEFDPDRSSQGDIDLKKLIDWTTTNPELMYKLFASTTPIAEESCQSPDARPPPTAAAAAVTTSTTKQPTDDPLAFRHFPTHKEYAVNTSGLCDSASIDVAASKSNGDDSASLPDMEFEAQKRNLIPGKFSDLPPADEWQELCASKEDERISLSLSSSSDTFEDQLNKMKMNWAGSVLRKTKRLHAMTSSSSSAENFDLPAGTHAQQQQQQQKQAAAAITMPPKDSFVDSNITNSSASISGSVTLSSTSNSIDKKPLNLKDFFRKELLRRCQSSSMSSSITPLDDDSTLSSNFLRSLLGTSRSSSSSLQLNGHAAADSGQTAADKHTTTQRTSTPVKVISTDSTSLSIGATAVAASATADGNLFSAESRLSSVKDNSANSSDKSKSDGGQPKTATADNFEALAVPPAKLQTRDVKSD